MFETQRMSKDYVLLDFLFDYSVYKSEYKVDFEKVFSNENMVEGQKFVDGLLQPLTDRYGPTSIADAFWPELFGKSGHYHSSPHRWNKKYGAAADVVFHDHVNRDEAPIKLCHEIDRSSQVFDRVITYAGSEFICLCYRKSRNRGALYENVRVPGQVARLVNHGYRSSKRHRRQHKPLTERADWRRAEGEGIGKSGKRLRAHHIRVGRYFVLLDFCRSVDGLRRGIRTVPPITLSKWNFPEVETARRFAEVLDPVVEQHGRVTALRGREPAGMSDDADAAKHRWVDSHASAHRLVFLVNREVEIESLSGDILDDERVISLSVGEHDRSSLEVALEISHFNPKSEWSSAHKQT